MKSIAHVARLALVGLFAWSGSALAVTELTIVSMQSQPAPKKALAEISSKFMKENPDISVKIETLEHEDFKANVENFLKDPKNDMVTWHAGNRARVLAEKGLLLPVDDAIKNIKEFGPGVRSSVTFNKKLYGIPHAYYHWTIYYNKDAFAKAEIKTPPKDWKGFVEAVEKLKGKGIIPITIGTKESWPTGGWFDFLGMYSYGYDFHMKLLEGKASYTSDKVKTALKHWVKLAELKSFPPNHTELGWKEASKLLLDGKAGMMLFGNFWIAEYAKANVKAGTSLESTIDSMKFPVLDAKYPAFGVAPTDILVGSAKTTHPEEVKKFLAFVARPDVQEQNAKILELLPPNMKVKVDEKDQYSLFGQKILNEAKGISQFFDRDADPEVARVGMDVMVDLIDHPGDLEKDLSRLEETRKKIHRK